MGYNRVVITGFSAVTPIGIGIERFWKGNKNGHSGIKKIEQFDIPNTMSQIAGIVDDFNKFNHNLTEEEQSNIDRACQFAIVAADEAIAMANFDESKINKDRCNVHLATAISNITKMEETLVNWTDRGQNQIQYITEQSKYLNEWFHFNTVSRLLAERYRLNGEHSVIATGCTGGVDAVGYSFQMIRDGEADVVLTGATEAPITPLVVASFSKINATSKRNDEPERASRPFDIDRSGFVLAEGCGIIILESLEHALGRGAKIYGEVMGYGSCNNALHMTDIPEDGESIAKSMSLALEDANITSEEIDYANLHGSSTPQNDKAETSAMKMVFGQRYKKIPVTSIKSQIGHALSASNSIEIVSSIMTINTGIVPPTINLENQDPQCGLNVISKQNQEFPIDKVIKVSSGFSGIHSSLVLGKYVGEQYV